MTDLSRVKYYIIVALLRFNGGLVTAWLPLICSLKSW